MGTDYKTAGHTVHIVTHLELWILKSPIKSDRGRDRLNLLCEADFSLYTFGVVWYSMNV